MQRTSLNRPVSGMMRSSGENQTDPFSLVLFLFGPYQHGSAGTLSEATRNACRRPRCEREGATWCTLVSRSLCHARTDEEEVEVWEAEMDDGVQTI